MYTGAEQYLFNDQDLEKHAKWRFSVKISSDGNMECSGLLTDVRTPTIFQIATPPTVLKQT